MPCVENDVICCAIRSSPPIRERPGGRARTSARIMNGVDGRIFQRDVDTRLLRESKRACYHRACSACDKSEPLKFVHDRVYRGCVSIISVRSARASWPFPWREKTISRNLCHWTRRELQDTQYREVCSSHDVAIRAALYLIYASFFIQSFISLEVESTTTIERIPDTFCPHRGEIYRTCPYRLLWNTMGVPRKKKTEKTQRSCTSSRLCQ